MSFFAFMDEAATPAAAVAACPVAELLDSLPRGDGRVQCLYLWLAYNLTEDVGVEAFEAACRATGRTVKIYGRDFVTGLDERATREWFLRQCELFSDDGG